MPGASAGRSEPTELNDTTSAKPSCASAAKLARALIECGGSGAGPAPWRFKTTWSPRERSDTGPYFVSTVSVVHDENTGE